MSFIEWSEELSVGIASIDAQHRQLVGMINELHDAMRGGRGREALVAIFDAMLKYTSYHFGHEEKLFQLHGYTGGDAHKREHEQLVKDALALKQRFERGDLVITIDTLDFLNDWLRKHIQGSDKRYSAYLLAKGVT